MGWRNRPTYKRNWGPDIDTVMFIDENGDASLSDIKKCIRKDAECSENNRYFTITGCIVNRQDFIETRDNIMNIKNNFWKEGLYEYKDKIKRVCFHSNEIRGKKGPFSDKTINYDEFIIQLSDCLSSLNVDIISSTLDKYKLCKTYKDPYHPYDLCVDFLLERFVKYFLPNDKRAIIMLEARGKKEDAQLLKHIISIIDNGTRYVNKNDFKKIKGVYFNPKWCEEEDCKKSYFGLEIADLISYPIFKYCKYNKKDQAFLSIEEKLYGYKNYYGKGLKKFP